MKTEELVRLLSSQVDAVERRRAGLRRVLTVGWAVAASTLLTLSFLGRNPALARDAAEPMFWLRECYCAALALTGLVAAARLGRPGAVLGWIPAAAAVPVILMWILAAAVLYSAPPGRQTELIFGRSAAVCPFLIALVAAPALVAAVWIMRGLAPTRTRLAGFAAGFAAGSVGALIYTLHCPELAAPFLAIWYLLGILLTAALGALSGPRLLAW